MIIPQAGKQAVHLIYSRYCRCVVVKAYRHPTKMISGDKLIVSFYYSVNCDGGSEQL